VVRDPDSDGIYTAEGILMTVTVTDQGGDRLEGATVVLEGANIRSSTDENVRGVTDSRGQVVFSGLRIEQFGTKLTTITVTVAKGDYGIDSSYEIPVVPG
jgi:protocatechuate 3,4-dioxygenase beta subunit